MIAKRHERDVLELERTSGSFVKENNNIVPLEPKRKSGLKSLVVSLSGDNTYYCVLCKQYMNTEQGIKHVCKGDKNE